MTEEILGKLKEARERAKGELERVNKVYNHIWDEAIAFYEEKYVSPDNDDYVFSLLAAKKDVNITLSLGGEELLISMLEKDGYKYDECINVWYISFKKIDSFVNKKERKGPVKARNILSEGEE